MYVQRHAASMLDWRCSTSSPGALRALNSNQWSTRTRRARSLLSACLPRQIANVDVDCLLCQEGDRLRQAVDTTLPRELGRLGMHAPGRHARAK